MTITSQLDQAEKVWRRVNSVVYPLFSSTPVKKIPTGTKKDAYWEFSTDDKAVYALIFQPALVEKEFEKSVIPLYSSNRNLKPVEQLQNLFETSGGSMEELKDRMQLSTMIYLLFHEVPGHPGYMPDGKEDEKKISKALFDGIKSVLPSASKRDIVLKVTNAKNMVYDFGDDNHIYSEFQKLKPVISNTLFAENISLGNQKIGLPDGVIPVFDVVEINKNRSKGTPPSPAYSLSRVPYGIFFAEDESLRKNLLDLFVSEARRTLTVDDVSKRTFDSLTGMVSGQKRDDLAKKGIDTVAYKASLKKMLTEVNSPDYLEHRDFVLKTIKDLLDDKSTRYTALREFIKPYADLLSTTKSDNLRHGTELSAGEAIESLQDIAGMMDESSANQLLEEIANSQYSDHTNNSVARTLSIMSLDEYYKKNCLEIALETPKKENISFEVGKEKIWNVDSSKRITAAELPKYSTHVMEMQKIVGPENPVLIQLDKQYFEIREYKLVENPIRAVTTVATGVELPDYVIPVLDSSGSMFENAGLEDVSGFVGSKCKYDVLMKVWYGLHKGMVETSKALKKNVGIGTVNFSQRTLWSGYDDLVKAYENYDNNFKKVLHATQAQNTILNHSVFDNTEKEKGSGKTVYSIITDGALQGDIDGVARKLDMLADKKDNAIVFIEIQGPTEFTPYIKELRKKHDNISYYNGNVTSISNNLKKVLIRYKK